MPEIDEQLEPTSGIDVAGNLAAVEQRIAAACAAAGRPRSPVTLVAVCKAQPVERIESALAAGQRVFGENYVQEAASRWPQLRERWAGVELHLIGPLQTNKVADAVRLFDVIQTLDRPKLAHALAREFHKQGVTRRLLVEVNTGEEAQKAGIHPSSLDDFLRLCRDELNLPVEGLMAIPPAEDDVAFHAALLAKLAHRHELASVSIGMSADYEAAIPFGATIVRVGTAIFGARPPKRLG